MYVLAVPELFLTYHHQQAHVNANLGTVHTTRPSPC